MKGYFFINLHMPSQQLTPPPEKIKIGKKIAASPKVMNLTPILFFLLGSFSVTELNRLWK
jgi:hypothetical protein